MAKTKQKILDQALKLFNQQGGVADVSIRQIAKEMGISHGNLIYHYKTKAEVIQGLHELLLAHALTINQNLDRQNFDISKLHEATLQGFEIVYEFRFLFYDLLYISNSYPKMRKTLIEVEKVRSEMYADIINLSIQNGLMREPEYQLEYEQLIKRIKIFSDHWISSASIYEQGEKHEIIGEYSRLFMSHFYPYLTEKGKEKFLIE